MRALLLVLALSQQPQSASSQNAKTPAAQQRGSDSLPLSVKLLNTGKTAEEAEQEDKRAAESTQINRRQLVANWIIAGLSLLAVGVSWWTFHRTRQITRQQLRAYIGTTKTQYFAPATMGADGEIRAAALNSGQTPAFKVKSWSGTHLREYPLAGDLPPHPDPEFGTTDTMLPPNAEFYLRGTVHAAKRKLLDGTNAIYFFGRIEYEDIFGHQHFTNYRFLWRGEATDGVGLKRDKRGNDGN
jgi:hypothetical protein